MDILITTDITVILYNIVIMRQCEIKDIKFYQARTKIIALGDIG